MAERIECQKCGYTTNSPKIMAIHRRHECPGYPEEEAVDLVALTLEESTVDTLREVARSRGLAPGNLRKAELIELIRRESGGDGR